MTKPAYIDFSKSASHQHDYGIYVTLLSVLLRQGNIFDIF